MACAADVKCDDKMDAGPRANVSTHTHAHTHMQLHNFARVLMADQKDVLAYLTGKQDTSQYLASVEDLTNIAVPQAQEAPAPAKAAEKPGEKRKRQEPTLDMTDENMIKAKQDLGARLDSMASKPLQGPEEKKKARVPMSTDDIVLTTSPYILGDAPITRGILEKERLHSNRTACLHTRNGKDFKHLHEILRGALREGKAGLLPLPSACPPRPLPPLSQSLAPARPFARILPRLRIGMAARAADGMRTHLRREQGKARSRGQQQLCRALAAGGATRSLQRVRRRRVQGSRYGHAAAAGGAAGVIAAVVLAEAARKGFQERRRSRRQHQARSGEFGAYHPCAPGALGRHHQVEH